MSVGLRPALNGVQRLALSVQRSLPRHKAVRQRLAAHGVGAAGNAQRSTLDVLCT